MVSCSHTHSDKIAARMSYQIDSYTWAECDEWRSKGREEDNNSYEDKKLDTNREQWKENQRWDGHTFDCHDDKKCAWFNTNE